MYVLMNKVYSKCLSFLLSRFDGLKLFTHQSDFICFEAFSLLCSVSRLVICYHVDLYAEKDFDPCHFAAPQLHDPSKRGVPFLVEFS